MPIRADNRKYYDARWRKFRLGMLEAAGNLCQRCDKPHRLPNIAHLTHDPTDQHFLAAVPELPRQKRHPAAHRHDPPDPGATARTVLAQRGDPLGALPHSHLADSVESWICFKNVKPTI